MSFISVKNVWQQYADQVVLEGLNLSVNEGEFCTLVGASGCGKSTFLRLLLGQERASRGEILLDGQALASEPDASRGVVFQRYSVFPHLSVLDNVAYGLKVKGVGKNERHKRAEEALDMVALGGYGARKPVQLSGGQRQRVALARALVNRPRVLLLDEPLVNLDYKLREELRDELTALFAAGDSTVIYATTEPGEALLLGGYTAVLDGGELLQYGPTAEVFRRPKSIRVARAFNESRTI